MDNDSEKILEQMRLQRDKVQSMLQITKELSLSTSADSVDIYADMVERRETVFIEVKEIDAVLKSPLLAHVWQANNDAFDKEAERITTDIKSIVKQIARYDEDHKAVCQLIIGDLKKNLKDISNQKSVNTYYQYNVSPDHGSYFDKKK